MTWGKRRFKAAALTALLALTAGLIVVQPTTAVAAPNDFGASALGSATVANHCRPRVPPLSRQRLQRARLSQRVQSRQLLYQQWHSLNGTLVSIQTGMCLDSNEQGDVYTRLCDGSPYQNWGSSDDFLHRSPETRGLHVAEKPESLRPSQVRGFRVVWAILGSNQ